jgi:hypothetical protein
MKNKKRNILYSTPVLPEIKTISIKFLSPSLKKKYKKQLWAYAQNQNIHIVDWDSGLPVSILIHEFLHLTVYDKLIHQEPWKSEWLKIYQQNKFLRKLDSKPDEAFLHAFARYLIFKEFHLLYLLPSPVKKFICKVIKFVNKHYFKIANENSEENEIIFIPHKKCMSSKNS